jgi:peptidylprolyl isomerase
LPLYSHSWVAAPEYAAAQSYAGTKAALPAWPIFKPVLPVGVIKSEPMIIREIRMRTAKMGDKVKVHFTGRLEDGTEFISSKPDSPVEFIIGEGTLIPGFETGTIGMAQSERRTIHLEPKDAFGDRRSEMISKVPRSAISQDIDLTVGRQLEFSSSSGIPVQVIVTAISDVDITIDANLPLAGQTLTFDIELLELF